MVKFSLQVKATLEGIEEIHSNHPEYNYLVKIKCTGCGEASDKWHSISESETFEGKSGRSENHFLAKCKLCGRENTMDIVDGSNGTYTNDDQGKFKSILTFDCRGMEPVAFSAVEGWIAKAESSGKVFENVDLSENEWVEYDERSKESVGVYDLESKFVSVK